MGIQLSWDFEGPGMVGGGIGGAGDCKEAIHRFEEKGDVLEKVNILRNCSGIKAIVDVLRIVAT